MADILLIIYTSLGTGLGIGVGTPLGNYIMERYLKPRIQRAEELHKKIKNERRIVS
jgi:hypothetical protein